MKNKCQKCQSNCEGANTMCWKHKPKKQLARSQIKPKPFIAQKTEKDIALENLQQHAMLLFFQELWKKRRHYSEVSGEFLGNQFSTIYQHHILGKKKYPEASFDEENIVFLTAQEHSSVELNKNKYEEINKRRIILNKKYNIL